MIETARIPISVSALKRRMENDEESAIPARNSVSLNRHVRIIEMASERRDEASFRLVLRACFNSYCERDCHKNGSYSKLCEQFHVVKNAE